MTVERREAKIEEIREVDGRHEADIRIVSYGVVDSYNTSWKFGVFTRSIAEGSVPAVWAHQSDRPIGVVSNFREHPTHLDATLEFLDFNAVPDARMAFESMKKGAIKGISYGFSRKAEEDDTENRGATRITDADLFEASPVLRASVPGSRVLAVRSDDKVPRTMAADILVRFSTGQMDLAEALTELKTSGVDATGALGQKFEAQATATDVAIGEAKAAVDRAQALTDKAIEASKVDVVVPAVNPDDEEVLGKLSALVRRT
jgi:HK97 family phage prohead protease